MPNIDHVDFFFANNPPETFQLSIGKGLIPDGGYIEGSNFGSYTANLGDAPLIGFHEGGLSPDHYVYRLAFDCQGLYLPALEDVGNEPYCMLLEMLTTPPAVYELQPIIWAAFPSAFEPGEIELPLGPGVTDPFANYEFVYWPESDTMFMRNTTINREMWVIPDGLWYGRWRYSSTGTIGRFTRPTALKLAFGFAYLPEEEPPPPPPPPLAVMDLPQIL